jgi:hypothetical protein
MYGVKNVLPQTAALNRTEWPFAAVARARAVVVVAALGRAV